MAFPLLVLLVILLVLPLPSHSEPFANDNAATFLANDPRLAKFQELWDSVGLSPTSLGYSNGTAVNATAVTLFAVTNDGWAVLATADPAMANRVTTNTLWREHLRQLLQWHVVVEDALTVAQLLDGRPSVETLIGGGEFPLVLDSSEKTIGGVPSSAIIDPDNSIASTNVTTMIHVIDQVLVPPYLTVNLMDRLLMNDGDDDPTSIVFAYTTMANLALYVGLDVQLNQLLGGDQDGWTLLVPPNRRFNRAQMDVASMLTEANKNYTRDFVLAHMIASLYDVTRITAEIEAQGTTEIMVKSELGTSLWLSTKDDRLRLQSTDILKTNQLAKNAILHVMDLPLAPPYISDMVELTAVSTSHDTSDCFRFFRQALLKSQDIGKTFNTSLTMFCPTREAFAGFDPKTFNRLLEPIWRRHSTEFLLNMLMGPAISEADLLAMAPSNLTMLNGMTYELRLSGPQVRLKNTAQEQSRMSFADIIAVDGYVHIMDTVLTPTAVSQSIYDRAMYSDEHSLLVENIDFVQLSAYVDRDMPLTWLASDNQAFRQVVFETLGGGEILKRHIFAGLLFCDVIANQTEIQAVNGEVSSVELRGAAGSGLWGPQKQKLYVGEAELYQCDVFAWNGIFHAVDRVIGLEIVAQAPSISTAPVSAPDNANNATDVAPVTEIARTLTQTLYGITNLTNFDIQEWQTVATYHVNEYLANITGSDEIVEAVLQVIAYYLNRPADTDQRALAPTEDTSDSVTIEYNQTLLLRQEPDENFLNFSLLAIGDMFLEPFNVPSFKQEFQDSLKDRGDFLSEVVSVSDVVFLGETPVSTARPTRSPTTSPAPTPELPKTMTESAGYRWRDGSAWIFLFTVACLLLQH